MIIAGQSIARARVDDEERSSRTVAFRRIDATHVVAILRKSAIVIAPAATEAAVCARGHILVLICSCCDHGNILSILWKCNRRIKPLMRRGYVSTHDYRKYRSTRNLKYLPRRGGEAERRSNRATVVAATM
jgi:hypothetical protein